MLDLCALPITLKVVDEYDIADLEEKGYQPSFTRLAGMAKQANLQVDPEAYLIQSLTGALPQNPKLQQVIQTDLPAGVATSLMKRLQGGNTVIR